MANHTNKKQRLTKQELYNQVFEQLKEANELEYEYQMLDVLMEKFKQLKELKNNSLDALLTKESVELLEKAERVSTFKKVDIINAGIQHRSNYVITASKSIKEGRESQQLAGTAYHSIDKFVEAIMKHNKAQKFKDERIAITQTVIMNSTKLSYREGNFDSVGFNEEGVNPNRAALKRYMKDKESIIIEHNVKMHVFGDIIKYVREPKNSNMKAKAKEFGWIEKD